MANPGADPGGGRHGSDLQLDKEGHGGGLGGRAGVGAAGGGDVGGGASHRTAGVQGSRGGCHPGDGRSYRPVAADGGALSAEARLLNSSGKAPAIFFFFDAGGRWMRGKNGEEAGSEIS